MSVSDPLTGNRQTKGALHVTIRDLLSTANYALATSTTAASITIVSGVKSIVVTNLDSTKANYVKISVGQTAVEAETNAANGDVVRADSEKSFAIPDSATHIGYVAAAATPAIVISQRG